MVNFVSETFVKLAFDHLPFGPSFLSIKYPVILLPPSYEGFCQAMLIELFVISVTLRLFGDSVG